MLRIVAKRLRDEGKKVGTIKICSYRPFPKEVFLKKIENINSIVVLDRALSLGAPMGPLCSDIVSTLHDSQMNDVKVSNMIYGLGGRDLSPQEAEYIFKKALKISEKNKVDEKIELIGVRE